jgi:hypothetical protein
MMFPTAAPSASPSSEPSSGPSSAPSSEPSSGPSSIPSAQPSAQPSADPSATPTRDPSAAPSSTPSAEPSNSPTGVPSASPSDVPSLQPSVEPSGAPSVSPSNSLICSQSLDCLDLVLAGNVQDMKGNLITCPECNIPNGASTGLCEEGNGCPDANECCKITNGNEFLCADGCGTGMNNVCYSRFLGISGADLCEGNNARICDPEKMSGDLDIFIACLLQSSAAPSTEPSEVPTSTPTP